MTTKKPMPTPYDAEIARLENLSKALPGDILTREHYWMLQGKAEGYRRAKTEDAPLVEALRATLPWISTIGAYTVNQQVRAAIAKATQGKEKS